MAALEEEIKNDMIYKRIEDLDKKYKQGLITQENFFPPFFALIDTQFEPEVTKWILDHFRLTPDQALEIVSKLPFETTAETAAIFAKKLPLSRAGHLALLTVFIAVLERITDLIALDIENGELDLGDVPPMRYPLLHAVVREDSKILPAPVEEPLTPGLTKEHGLQWVERELWLSAWYINEYAKKYGSEDIDKELKATRVTPKLVHFLVDAYTAITTKNKQPRRATGKQ
jgi:hypothetical protein